MKLLYAVLLLSETKIQNYIQLIQQTRWCEKTHVLNEKIMTQLCTLALNRNSTPAKQLYPAQWDT